ncbi:MAG TPA: enoyl-CoA hydratase-related protein [Acidimicrobiales bacterium]|nr:enoyl-CoA hydratase-related protein [Acidimicrobiales bacterium]
MIHSEPRGHVTVVTIDRPDRRNAVDHATLDALAAVLDEVGDDVRALVLTGAAGHFCAGADLSGVEDASFTTLLRSVLDRLRLAPFVTLAAADGAALGAGTQLAIACDLRVATAQTSFGIPAGRLGLAVDAWTVDRLALLAGHGPARAMLLAAEVVKGDEAHRLGLVQRLGSLDDALAWADDIAALAPLTLRAHKAALEGRPDAAAALARAWASDDLTEGLAAFRERRRPVFHAR